MDNDWDGEIDEFVMALKAAHKTDIDWHIDILGQTHANVVFVKDDSKIVFTYRIEIPQEVPIIAKYLKTND